MLNGGSSYLSETEAAMISRWTVQKTITVQTSHSSQAFLLLCGIDSLSDEAVAKVGSHADQCMDDCFGVPIPPDRLHEASVDLDLVDRKVAQARKG